MDQPSRVKRKLSAANPGPNAMAMPRACPCSASMRASTNINVAEDMLPCSRKIVREASSASGDSSSACSTASRMDRPPA